MFPVEQQVSLFHRALTTNTDPVACVVLAIALVVAVMVYFFQR